MLLYAAKKDRSSWRCINEPVEVQGDEDLLTSEPTITPTAGDLAAATQHIQDAQDAQDAKNYAKLQALATMTPAQIQAWVQANVNTLADAKDALKTLAIAVGILARRL
jgi:phosphoenolpyruvate-protein kinase (PTS system EI component)